MVDLIIHPMKYPADLSPLPVNSGQLAIETLSKVAGGGMLHVNAARSWKALVAAAFEAGFILTYTGTTACYRDFVRQTNLFKERYRHEGQGGGCKQWLFKHLGDNKMWCKIYAYLATAAVPGTSNHGWGLAIDMALDGYTPDTWKAVTSNPSAHNWLQANVRRFGFSYEIQSEPWHIRLVVGDDITPAVLAFEQGTPPPPIPEEDDMIELMQDINGVWAVAPGWNTRRAAAPDDITLWVNTKRVETRIGANGALEAVVTLIDQPFMNRIKDVSPGTPQLAPGEAQKIIDATVAGVVAKLPSGSAPVDNAAIATAVAVELHKRLGS